MNKCQSRYYLISVGNLESGETDADMMSDDVDLQKLELDKDELFLYELESSSRSF